MGDRIPTIRRLVETVAIVEALPLRIVEGA